MGGFDCPGCAWPEPDRERSHAEFCENGAKHVADEATTKRVTPEFFQQWSVADLSQQSDHWLGTAGTSDAADGVARGATHYEPIDWDDAFALIAGELNSLNSPDEAIFYTSGRASNEAAFLYQLFVRQFGTNNLPDCSNMCHESSGTALSETIGVGKGTVTLEDFELAQAIFVIGQNPGTNHPRMLTALQKAKRNGCEIVHINPLPETGMTRFKHPQQIGDLLGEGNAAGRSFPASAHQRRRRALERHDERHLRRRREAPGSVLDHEFIEQHTTGFAEFKEALGKVHWGDLIEQCGVPKTKIEDAVKIFIKSERTIFCWAMGLTQHKNAVANIQEIVNLMLLRGQIGKTRAPDFVRCAAIAMCRAIAPWASGNDPPKAFSISSQLNLISSRRVSMASIRSKQSRRCTMDGRRSSLRWAATFFRRRRTRNTRPRRCVAAA